MRQEGLGVFFSLFRRVAASLAVLWAHTDASVSFAAVPILSYLMRSFGILGRRLSTMLHRRLADVCRLCRMVGPVLLSSLTALFYLSPCAHVQQCFMFNFRIESPAG